jgi:RND family efflux transporter, MFP subunit
MLKKVWLLSGIFLSISVVAAEPVLEARAVIKSLDRATLSGELVAKIIRIPKRMGEHFRKGENLLVLDCAVFEAQKEKVQAELDLAKSKVANARTLNKLHSIGAMDLAMAEAEARKSAAELHIAELNTDRCNIKAPYDGMVVNVMVNENEIVGQQHLMEIVGTKRLEAEIIVPAQTISWLKIGTNVVLKIDETGEEIRTKISYISPAIDPVSQTLQLRAELNSQTHIIPGMSAAAQLMKSE